MEEQIQMTKSFNNDESKNDKMTVQIEADNMKN